MKETPSATTRQCRRSSFARDEARSRQERAKSIANFNECSLEGSNLVFPRQSRYFDTRCTSHV